MTDESLTNQLAARQTESDRVHESPMEGSYIVTAYRKRSDGLGHWRVFKDTFASLAAAETFSEGLHPAWQIRRIYKLSHSPIYESRGISSSLQDGGPDLHPLAEERKT